MQYAGKGVTMVVAGSFLLATAGGLEVAGTTPAAAQDGGAGAAVAPAALGNTPAPVAAPINLGGAAAAPVITTPSAASAAGGGGAAAAPVTATAAASESLDQLVAPIALYPDSLVAQILAAATYPAEIVEADRWVQQNPNLDGPALAQAVDQLPWDASVKALVAFPAVLSNLDQNLTWTVALGEADESQPQAVFNAVQAMRQRAQQAGTLQTTPQQTVTAEGGNIVIQPASPDYVYVPEYDPWLVYGAPVAAYPYWDPFPGLYLDSPGFVFGLGVGIGVFAGFGWGWGHWGADWHHGWLLHDHQVYGAPGGRGMIRGYGGFAGDRFHGFAPGGVRPGGFRGFDHAVEGRGFVGHAGGVGEYRAGGFAGGGFHGGGGHR